jgi:hypothetical protein
MKISAFASLLLLPAFFASAIASAALQPSDFAHSYVLVEARYGLLCEPTLQGFLSFAPVDNAVQLDLGPWAFTQVNAGRITMEDEFSRDRSESFTTSDRIIQRSESFTKSIRETTIRETQASLKGDGLHIVSQSHTFSAGDPRGYKLYFECVYRRDYSKASK